MCYSCLQNKYLVIYLSFNFKNLFVLWASNSLGVLLSNAASHKFYSSRGRGRRGIKRISRYSINAQLVLAFIIIRASKSIGIKCLRRRKNHVYKTRISRWKLVLSCIGICIT